MLVGHSLKHLVTTIEDLSAHGVAFISLCDNLDLSTPSDRLMNGENLVEACAWPRELLLAPLRLPND